MKSFDPGQRGWLSAGQMRRAYITLGLTPDDTCDESVSTDTALNNLRKAQEIELFSLIAAGMNLDGSSTASSSTPV